MAIRFTEANIRNMRKVKKNTTIGGLGYQRGIRLRLSPSGLKTWYFYFTFKGKKQNFKIGHWPTYSVEQVDKLVKQYREQIEEGTNPKLHRKRPKDALPWGTCNDLFDAYYLLLEMKQATSINDVKSTIKNNTSEIKNLLVKDIVRDDIDKILQTITNRNALTLAKKFRTIMHAAFNLAIGYKDFTPNKELGTKPNVDFGITHNVVSEISDKYKVTTTLNSNKRYLEMDEIGDLLNSPLIPPEHILRLKLLFSFGQRIIQVLHTPMSEINFDKRIWYWEQNRLKKDKDHLLPLTDLHIKLLKECYALCGSKGNWLFPKLNNPELDRTASYKTLSGHVRAYCKKTGVKRFTIGGDIRRTVKTHAIRLGIPKDIIDRIQHHIVSDTSEDVYNCHDYMDEKREALEVWCNELEKAFKPTNKPDISTDTFQKDLEASINAAE
ncbi:MAG: tyrosine-type recombinase/integrase [Gammaproteobacteria bacterium]|nr:tyrosine-type recombinase/integrase [Gammaproteobacteria bacterium]